MVNQTVLFMNSLLISSIWSFRRLAVTTILVLVYSLTISNTTAEVQRPKIGGSGLYANSEVLISGGYHTVVPKGAVLAIPTNLKSKVSTKPSGDFLLWPKFLLKNHSWLLKKEITYAQASGENPINKTQMNMLTKSGKVVIAVMRNNPTSVAMTKDSKNSDL